MKETMYDQELEALKHMTHDEIQKAATEAVEKAEMKLTIDGVARVNIPQRREP